MYTYYLIWKYATNELYFMPCWHFGDVLQRSYRMKLNKWKSEIFTNTKHSQLVSLAILMTVSNGRLKIILDGEKQIDITYGNMSVIRIIDLTL